MIVLSVQHVVACTKKWINESFSKEILLKIDNSREYSEMNDEGYPISLMLWSLIGITYTWYYTKESIVLLGVTFPAFESLIVIQYLRK